ncbi:MAG: peptidylprolyl isomerase [Gammaproteobacteria bacterium]|nr:MAG: peptidylprolyl isomerase [Gammaproteobacteria bacterium]
MKRYSALMFSGLLVAGLLGGCNQGGEQKSGATEKAAPAVTSEKATDEQALAVVNGEPITREDVMAFIQYKQQIQPNTPINPGLLVNEMINTKLLVQEAERKGLEQREDVQRQLQVHRAAVLVNALVGDFLKGLDLSDEELRKEYEAQISGIEKHEYKARHILLKDKAKAEQVLKELKPDGSNFAELAKKYSEGPSGKNGGDLGWFSASSMVPEFGDAVKHMKKGEISKQPVKSEFGWHIIWLEDVRDTPVPSFEESRERLKMIVAQKKLQEHIAELREKAKIEVQGMQAPAPATPAPASEPAADSAAPQPLPAPDEPVNP